ncbi:hypothetical protein [Antrihabitans sp. YC2-6]|uniref:hypothetical protein n=1 Tax=Antrihabitans sp. YC2-6 TaxID=2799498 RepID=UPI0018F58DEE|nr:hypothetical protein [Antrihabitans sp. YC2-6]MBJ8347902.1 hypothetical protein [Antrihabitans sp. YC2-6]
MIYLLAAVGLVTVVVLFWKAFGPDIRPADQRRTLGPDDDPEFLWRLNRESRRSGKDTPEAGPNDPVN